MCASTAGRCVAVVTRWRSWRTFARTQVGPCDLFTRQGRGRARVGTWVPPERGALTAPAWWPPPSSAPAAPSLAGLLVDTQRISRLLTET